MENFVSFAWAELSAHGRPVSLGDRHVRTKDNMGEHSWGRRVAKMDGKVSPTLFIFDVSQNTSEQLFSILLSLSRTAAL